MGSHGLPVMPTDTSLLVRSGRTGRGLAHLRQLDTYLRTLVAAPEHVSRSPTLTSFFEPQPSDLDPTLPPGRCLTLPQPPACRSTGRTGEA